MEDPLTPEEKTGRVLVWLIITSIVLISGLTIAAYVSAKGVERLPTQAFRFLTTIALMWWLYRGSPLAKWICVLLFGLAGFFATLVALFGDPQAKTIMVKMQTIYLWATAMLITSSNANAFLRRQRDRRRASTFEAE